MSAATLEIPPPKDDVLVELETIIAGGLRSFVEVGRALEKIKREELYKASYPTFEAYCLHRWDLGRSRVHQLRDAAVVATRLSTIVDIAKPTTESQVRPLTALKTPGEQEKAWRQAVKASGGSCPTAAEVTRAVMAMQPQPKPQEPEPKKWDSPAIQLFEEWLIKEFPEADAQKVILKEIRSWIDARPTQAPEVKAVELDPPQGPSADPTQAPEGETNASATPQEPPEDTPEPLREAETEPRAHLDSNAKTDARRKLQRDRVMLELRDYAARKLKEKTRKTVQKATSDGK